ncbi:MAG TPA: sulfate ABC transporter substrate-binding protein [Bacteroidia bacterium]|nr:sulfate ABC transporter substrate-binding protein [Bacteroidia bacterium]
MKIKTIALLGLSLVLSSPLVRAQEIINVSYDPTREFYTEFNAAFSKYWKEKTGKSITVSASHGGSSKQARAVIDGLEADVVTLALAADVDAIAETGLLPKDWQKRLEKNSAPYQSTLAFLVRKGNPKGIKNWDDLVREGVEVITPNPKTSGVARWNFLAAWGWALQTYGGDEAKAKEYITKLFENVPVLDSGARGASNTFIENGTGDVLINWENELLLATKGAGAEKFEIVVPSLSILAEPTVALVDKNVDKKGTREVAEAYLEYLYSDEGQDLAGKHFFRPSNPEILAKYASQYPDLKLFTIDEVFGGWGPATKKFFADGGVFDQIYLK